MWLSSELMFFAGLFAAYFTLRGSSDLWPPDDVELETVILLISSGTIHNAVTGRSTPAAQRPPAG